MNCRYCGSHSQTIAVTKKPAVSVAGMLSLIIMLMGLVILIMAPAWGLGIIILGLALGLSRPTKTILICPDCKRSR